MEDTMTKYPCEAATVEELDKKLQAIYSGYGGADDNIKPFVRETASSNIPWEQVRHLRIIGDEAPKYVERYQKQGIGRGSHLSADGSWLLVLLPKQSHPEDHLRRCGRGLESLDLRNIRMDALEVPEALSGLKRLRIRDCFGLTNISGLGGLKALKELFIYDCKQLASLKGIEELARLITVHIRYCSNLATLPDLKNLTQLTMLSLVGCTRLTGLLGLENLRQLRVLHLTSCPQLTALPAFESFEQLEVLSLAGCTVIEELPESIRQLRGLRFLGLDSCHFRTLPDWIPEIAERFIRYPFDKGKNKAVVGLMDAKIDDIPDMSIFDQPYEMIVKFFEDRKKGRTHPLNEIKVVFLGDGEAGKSHTIARLMNDGGDPDYATFDGQSTPGIVIRNKEYTVGDRTFTVHYWDFGGQEIMHSMHRIFLTKRTLYVILLNARDDTQSDRAKYWLHNVRSFAPDAPVLLVLNKIDQNENASVDERDLRGRYDKLTQVVKLSAKDFSPEQFNECFTGVLLEEIVKTGFLDAQWPIDWSRVKERLENMTTHYITGDDYQDICDECGVAENRKDLLHWFNDLGVSFCCEDDYALDDYVILRPDWITNALYIILFNALEGANNGLIPREAIYDILKRAHRDPAVRRTLPKAKYSNGDIQYVLGIMRKFSLSLQHGPDHEFIPMLCQQNSTVDIAYYQKDAEVLEFNMDFDYLPNNLLHRLMVERHAELDMDNVWRTGARFQIPELGYSAVVAIDGDTLRFFIRHRDPMHRPNTYLSILKSNVDRIVKKMGLKEPAYKLIYKLDGKRDEFDYEDVMLSKELGDTTVISRAHKKKIPIADILNQSAPDTAGQERELLDDIARSCGNLQDEPVYRLKKKEGGNGYVNGDGMEDLRNRRVRDDLLTMGHMLQDQSQRGLGGGGKRVGEVDLVVLDEQNSPWTIIEALRIADAKKKAVDNWDSHLNKLLGRYNGRGLPRLYLLTYVDATLKTFDDIWETCRDHIKAYHPGEHTYRQDSLVELKCSRNSIKAARCYYDCGSQETLVYHIFARIPTEKE